MFLSTVVAVLVVAPPAAHARTLCGPSSAKTLARSAEARVYTSEGSVRSCTRKKTLRLGSTAKVIDVSVAGHFAMLRSRVKDGQAVRVVDLRTGRTAGRSATYKRVGVRKLDPAGVGVFHAVLPNGAGVVSDTRGQGLHADRADDVGLKGFYIAYRRGESLEIQRLGGDDPATRPAAEGTLLQVGDVRLVVRGDKVWARAGTGPSTQLNGTATNVKCDARTTCSGWGQMRLVGDRLLVPVNDFSGGSSVSAYDVAAGRVQDICPLEVKSQVVTESARIACGVAAVDGRRIVSEGVVLDAGDTVDPSSLVRRGDQLVWLNGGVERTAPIPR